MRATYADLLNEKNPVVQNLKVLREIAFPSKHEEISKDLPSFVQERLVERQQGYDASDAKFKADVVISLLSAAEADKADAEQEISRLKETLSRKEYDLAQLTKCIAYGNKTSNYLPLVCCSSKIMVCDLVAADVNPDMVIVPENWSGQRVGEQAAQKTPVAEQKSLDSKRVMISANSKKLISQATKATIGYPEGVDSTGVTPFVVTLTVKGKTMLLAEKFNTLDSCKKALKRYNKNIVIKVE